jgi:heat shock protein HspQ
VDLVCGDEIDHLVGQIVHGGQLDVELGLGWLVGHKHHEVLGVVEDAEDAGANEEEEPNALVERVEENKYEQKELAKRTNKHGYLAG